MQQTMRRVSLMWLFVAALLAGVESQTLSFNVGGPELADIRFAADPTPNLLSRASATVSVPAGTVRVNSSWAPIYSTYRFAFGGNLAYRFQVRDGNYSVSLAFAETYSRAWFAGARQFDVVINGVVHFARLDVFATVGANRALYLRVDDVRSVDGQLSILMRRIEGKQNPLLSAMLIKPSVG